MAEFSAMSICLFCNRLLEFVERSLLDVLWSLPMALCRWRTLFGGVKSAQQVR